MSNLFYVLAKRPDIQEKIREEVREARERCGGEIDYDTLAALPWVDAVIRETLRVYPPAPMLDRVASQDAVLPLAYPIRSSDGQSEISEIVVKKGTVLFVSIIGANRCKKVWGEDADEWKPERWIEPKSPKDYGYKFPGVYSQMFVQVRSCFRCSWTLTRI